MSGLKFDYDTDYFLFDLTLKNLALNTYDIIVNFSNIM